MHGASTKWCLVRGAWPKTMVHNSTFCCGRELEVSSINLAEEWKAFPARQMVGKGSHGSKLLCATVPSVGDYPLVKDTLMHKKVESRNLHVPHFTLASGEESNSRGQADERATPLLSSVSSPLGQQMIPILSDPIRSPDRSSSSPSLAFLRVFLLSSPVSSLPRGRSGICLVCSFFLPW